MDEKQPSAPWLRLERVIRWANKTPNAFARHIGLARGENLYQIKRGNNGISLKLAERIVQLFPEVNRLWLLTGEGEMLLRDASQRVKAIPLYRVDLAQGLRDWGGLTADSSLILPPVGECDLAIGYEGEEMAPVVPQGVILLLKKIDPAELIAGKIYAVVTKNFVTLRKIEPADGEQQLRLVAGDRTRYEDMLLAVSAIESLYAVRGQLICNN